MKPKGGVAGALKLGIKAIVASSTTTIIPCSTSKDHVRGGSRDGDITSLGMGKTRLLGAPSTLLPEQYDSWELEIQAGVRPFPSFLGLQNDAPTSIASTPSLCLPPQLQCFFLSAFSPNSIH